MMRFWNRIVIWSSLHEPVLISGFFHKPVFESLVYWVYNEHQSESGPDFLQRVQIPPNGSEIAVTRNHTHIRWYTNTYMHIIYIPPHAYSYVLIHTHTHTSTHAHTLANTPKHYVIKIWMHKYTFTHIPLHITITHIYTNTYTSFKCTHTCIIDPQHKYMQRRGGGGLTQQGD